MIAPLIFFIGSGLVLVILIVHKHLEITHGKGFVVVDTLSHFDEKVTDTTGKVKNYVALINKRNTFHFLNTIFVFIVRVLLAIVEWAREHIHALYEKAQNIHPHIKENAEASVYLKQISEVKEEKKAD